MANAKEVDPDTRRTIPVITKPDLIDSGAEDDVLQLLRGEKIKFDLGFHMVKGRGQADLDQKIDIAAGLTAESTFFGNTRPWRAVECRTMFGTAHLRTKLGDLQLQMIRDTIPDIVQDMANRKLVAAEELREMGQVCGTAFDRQLYFRRRVNVFLQHLRASLTGNAYVRDENPASAFLYDSFEEFKEKVKAGRLSNITSLREGLAVIVRIAEGNDIKGTIKEIKGSGEVVVAYLDEENNEKLTYELPSSRVRRDRQWLIDIIARRRTEALPCFLNEQVFRAICLDFMEADWFPHCEKIIETTLKNLCRAIDECLYSSDVGRRYYALRGLVQRKAKAEAHTLFQREETRLGKHLANERKPYTQNDALFEKLGMSRSQALQDETLALLDSLSSSRECDVKTVIKRVRAFFRERRNRSMDENIAEEMEAVLDSYGMLAQDRLVDTVPLFCRRIIDDSVDQIRDELDRVRDEELQAVMQDKVTFLQRYKEFQQEIAEMEKGLDLVNSLS